MPASVVFGHSSLGPFAVQAGTCAHSICTCLAHSALSRTHSACDTLAGTSTVTTSTVGVAEDTATVVCDAAVIASLVFCFSACAHDGLWSREEPTALPTSASPRPLIPLADAPLSAACAPHTGPHRKCACRA